MERKDDFQELFERLKNIDTNQPSNANTSSSEPQEISDQVDEVSMESVFADADLKPTYINSKQTKTHQPNTNPFSDQASQFQDGTQTRHTPQSAKQAAFVDNDATKAVPLSAINQTRHESGKAAQHTANPPQNKGNKTRNGIIYALFVVGFSIILSVVMIYAIYDIFGFDKPDEQIVVNIDKNTSLGELSDVLKDNKVINQAAIFTLYAKIKDVEMYNAGEYKLNRNMSYDQIIYSMRSQSRTYNTVKITITEGKSAVEIAKLLEENGVCSASAFLEAVRKNSYGFSFEGNIPTDKEIYFPLEGYLFPDTYEFYVDENVDSVVKRFLTTFDIRLTTEMYARMEELGMSLHETLTLASIIQKEAGNEQEMKRVSSVFHNRLNNSRAFPTLDSDVTIFYVNDFIKPYSDSQALYDSYNSYRCKGLPVGPITNPGLAAIEAALYPEDTSYYFFVTDANGKYYYAQTVAEHDANCAEAEKVGEVHGTDTNG